MGKPLSFSTSIYNMTREYVDYDKTQQDSVSLSARGFLNTGLRIFYTISSMQIYPMFR